MECVHGVSTDAFGDGMVGCIKIDEGRGSSGGGGGWCTSKADEGRVYR